MLSSEKDLVDVLDLDKIVEKWSSFKQRRIVE